MVTAYGDYRVDAVHTVSNCASSLKFKVVPTGTENNPKSAKKKDSTPLVIAIAVPSAVALAALGILIGLLLRRKNKKKENTNPADVEMKGKDNWEIDYNELSISKELGRGVDEVYEADF